MTSRRPIPAIIFLLALSLISGLVWWRVLHRDDSTASPTTSTKPTTCATPRVEKITLPKPATVTVTVLNATNTSGLAKSVSAKFQQRGFKVGKYDNDTATATVTQVRYASKNVAAARLVQIYLPGSQLVVSSSATGVTVSLGSTFKDLATPTQVAKSMSTATSVKTC